MCEKLLFLGVPNACWLHLLAGKTRMATRQNCTGSRQNSGEGSISIIAIGKPQVCLEAADQRDLHKHKPDQVKDIMELLPSPFPDTHAAAASLSIPT